MSFSLQLFFGRQTVSIGSVPACLQAGQSNILSTFPHYITQTTHFQSKQVPRKAASSLYHNTHRNTSSTARLDLSSLNDIKINQHIPRQNAGILRWSQSAFIPFITARHESIKPLHGSHSVDRALNAETAAVEDVGVNHSG